MKPKPSPKVKNEWIMWAALAVSLVAGVLAPFFGAAPQAAAVPFVVATLIAVNIGWMRDQVGRGDRQR